MRGLLSTVEQVRVRMMVHDTILMQGQPQEDLVTAYCQVSHILEMIFPVISSSPN